MLLTLWWFATLRRSVMRFTLLRSVANRGLTDIRNNEPPALSALAFSDWVVFNVSDPLANLLRREQEHLTEILPPCRWETAVGEALKRVSAVGFESVRCGLFQQADNLFDCVTVSPDNQVN